MEIREELWLRSWVGLSCDGKSQVKMGAVELSREGAYAPQAWKRWVTMILELETPQHFVFASAYIPQVLLWRCGGENITERDVRTVGVERKHYKTSFPKWPSKLKFQNNCKNSNVKNDATQNQQLEFEFPPHATDFVEQRF